MYYKNVSLSVKTFHGVTFNPGATEQVDHYINDLFMIPVSGPSEVKTVSTETTSQQPVKQQKPSSEKPKKSEEKKEPEPPAEDAEKENSDSNT